MKRFVWALIAGSLFASGAPLHAATVQTLGAGSAVSAVDRSAVFNALSVNGTPLSDYTEGQLFIRVDGDSWIGDGYPVPFDPFHIPGIPYGPFYFPFGGSPGWVTIEPTDSRRIYALEFLYGNGWTTGDPYGTYPWGNDLATVEWQSWRNGSMVSSGTIGGGPLLEMGTVVGFYDAAGFDQLLVKCTIAGSSPPDYQALALDNLQVQLTRIGACCLVDGTCVMYASAACAAAGGIYHGDGSLCDPYPCATTVAGGPEGLPTTSLSASPNPSTGGTLVQYQLPRTAEVSLAIFDVSGAMVRQLAEGTQAAGLHEVRWDGRGERGEPRPSGIYFCRLDGPGISRTAKLLVTR